MSDVGRRSEVDDLLETCKRYRDKDDRVQTHEYEDIVHSQLTVRAFYLKVRAPDLFDVQSMERPSEPRDYQMCTR